MQQCSQCNESIVKALERVLHIPGCPREQQERAHQKRPTLLPVKKPMINSAPLLIVTTE